jgi:hypothetical protein
MKIVAFLTLGVMQQPDNHPLLQGFNDRVEGVYADADAFDGFIARFPDDFTTGASWHLPRPALFHGEEYAGRLAISLTLWRDLESVFAYSYSGPHSEALGKRKDWFLKPRWPSYVAWWIDASHVPTRLKAYAHYDHLCGHGATANAFDFRTAFDETGFACIVDLARAKRIMDQHRPKAVSA